MFGCWIVILIFDLALFFFPLRLLLRSRETEVRSFLIEESCSLIVEIWGSSRPSPSSSESLLTTLLSSFLSIIAVVCCLAVWWIIFSFPFVSFKFFSMPLYSKMLWARSRYSFASCDLPVIMSSVPRIFRVLPKFALSSPNNCLSSSSTS